MAHIARYLLPAKLAAYKTRRLFQKQIHCICYKNSSGTAMTEQIKSSFDGDGVPPTVSDQVFEIFCQALEQKPEFKDIAGRFRSEKGRSETALRKILFGEEE